MSENTTMREMELRVESHEEICSLRYKIIDEKLEGLGKAMVSMDGNVDKIDGKFDKLIWTVLTGMAGTIVAICMTLFTVYVKSHG